MLRHVRSPSTRTVLSALLIALASSACGIKGPLKLPPAAKPAEATTTVPGPPAPAPNAPAPAQQPTPPAPPGS